MGFTNSMLSAFKKMGCISQPRVEDTLTLPPDQPDDVETVDGPHEIKETEEKINGENSKEETMEVKSEPKTEASGNPPEPKEEEEPKIDLASAVPLETIEEEEEESQHKTTTEEAAATMADTKCEKDEANNGKTGAAAES